MTTLGLSPTTSFAAPAAFLAWNWCFAYVALSSRPWKQACGIDHNGNPRQDVAKYADTAIREGKMTRAQLERIQRVEAAGANSTDGFAFFASSGKVPYLHIIPVASTPYLYSSSPRKKRWYHLP
jgi:hypothetical protein